MFTCLTRICMCLIYISEQEIVASVGPRYKIFKYDVVLLKCGTSKVCFRCRIRLGLTR